MALAALVVAPHGTHFSMGEDFYMGLCVSRRRLFVFSNGNRPVDTSTRLSRRQTRPVRNSPRLSRAARSVRRQHRTPASIDHPL